MELKGRKNAIALIELLICLTMTAVLMLMLFGIVTKKTKSAITRSDGVFYCWKDWNGALYQKKSEESIQHVSDCKVKIPKDAQNVQVFIIGGGAGGYRFDSDTIKNILNSDSSYPENADADAEKLCLNFVGASIYTKLQDTRNDKTYDIMTTCEMVCNSTCECNVTPVYKRVSEIMTDSPSELFSQSFMKDLFNNGYCYLPVYRNSEIKYIRSSSSMASESLYYYKGSILNKPCIGVCSGSDGDFDCKVSSGDGTCLQDGILKSRSNAYEPTLAYSNQYNKFSYNSIKSSINIGEYKEAQTGDLKRGYAEPGREYTITSDQVGSGGQPNNPGGATTFGNLKANGGTLKSIANTVINIPSENNVISSIADLDRTRNISICAASGLNCNGAASEQLRELADSDSKIKVSETTEIPVASYNIKTGKWSSEGNPQKSNNEVEKTGFGLFGASGSAVDCAITYYPVKKFHYNSLSRTRNNANNVDISSFAPGGAGMGGAIIIKWD